MNPDFVALARSKPGELTYAKDIYRYYEQLAKVSPRARYWKIGTTEEGRDLVALRVIVSGIKGGQVYGETDDFSYNITKDPVHLNDLNATVLHCLGIDHSRFTFKFQGLDQRLTGVEEQHVIRPLLK